MKIYNIRGLQVMLDKDLAELYQTETRILKQVVKRNIDRFSSDFVFELNISLVLKSTILFSIYLFLKY